MPVDLDTRLRALGDALVRESAPITLDELGAGDVTMRRSDEKEPEDQTREDELPVFDRPDPDAATP